MKGELHGDNVPEPIECNLDFQIKVEQRAMTVDDAIPYIKDEQS